MTTPAHSLLSGFLRSPGARNQWLEAPDLHVYVRRGFHALRGQGRHCLDIANAVLITQPSGAYVQFILSLPQLLRETPKEHCAPLCIYIENVGFPGLDRLFRRLGYTQDGPDAHCPCFFKEVL